METLQIPVQDCVKPNSKTNSISLRERWLINEILHLNDQLTSPVKMPRKKAEESENFRKGLQKYAEFGKEAGQMTCRGFLGPSEEESGFREQPMEQPEAGDDDDGWGAINLVEFAMTKRRKKTRPYNKKSQAADKVIEELDKIEDQHDHEPALVIVNNKMTTTKLTPRPYIQPARPYVSRTPYQRPDSSSSPKVGRNGIHGQKETNPREDPNIIVEDVISPLRPFNINYNKPNLKPTQVFSKPASPGPGPARYLSIAPSVPLSRMPLPPALTVESNPEFLSESDKDTTTVRFPRLVDRRIPDVTSDRADLTSPTSSNNEKPPTPRMTDYQMFQYGNNKQDKRSKIPKIWEMTGPVVINNAPNRFGRPFSPNARILLMPSYVKPLIPRVATERGQKLVRFVKQSYERPVVGNETGENKPEKTSDTPASYLNESYEYSVKRPSILGKNTKNAGSPRQVIKKKYISVHPEVAPHKNQSNLPPPTSITVCPDEREPWLKAVLPAPSSPPEPVDEAAKKIEIFNVLQKMLNE